jgi:hypothetical protein
MNAKQADGCCTGNQGDRIEVSGDPRGDATLRFETAGDADVLLILPMMALAELEALLALASQAQAKNQPKQ